MAGFKDFILRGNLIELAVAFVMGGAFATVVTATVALIMGLIGKVGGVPDFQGWEPGGLPFGAWLTSVVAFLILAAVVYFVIVKPYTVAKDAFYPAEDSDTPADIVLLEEIRDLLAARSGQARDRGQDAGPESY